MEGIGVPAAYGAQMPFNGTESGPCGTGAESCAIIARFSMLAHHERENKHRACSTQGENFQQCMSHVPDCLDGSRKQLPHGFLTEASGGDWSCYRLNHGWICFLSLRRTPAAVMRHNPAVIKVPSGHLIQSCHVPKAMTEKHSRDVSTKSRILTSADTPTSARHKQGVLRER